jgi:hypothetical protein
VKETQPICTATQYVLMCMAYVLLWCFALIVVVWIRAFVKFSEGVAGAVEVTFTITAVLGIALIIAGCALAEEHYFDEPTEEDDGD